MTERELDQLLGPDVDGIVLCAVTPDGSISRVALDRYALCRPQVTRAVLRRTLGHLVDVPLYDDDEHDQLVRELAST